MSTTYLHSNTNTLAIPLDVDVYNFFQCKNKTCKLDNINLKINLHKQDRVNVTTVNYLLFLLTGQKPIVIYDKSKSIYTISVVLRKKSMVSFYQKVVQQILPILNPLTTKVQTVRENKSTYYTLMKLYALDIPEIKENEIFWVLQKANPKIEIWLNYLTK